MLITTEHLAYWYLRLNGFLTIANFLVHPEGRQHPSSTEVDVLGARFPHRSENLRRPMQDDPALIVDLSRILLVLAEAKFGHCDLNGPWTDPESVNLLKVVKAIGAFPTAAASAVAHALQREGTFADDRARITLLCLGQCESADIATRFPRVPQITWHHALDFIYGRLRDYSRDKAQHSQWDADGQSLWDVAVTSPTVELFHETVTVTPPTPGGLPAA